MIRWHQCCAYMNFTASYEQKIKHIGSLDNTYHVIALVAKRNKNEFRENVYI